MLSPFALAAKRLAASYSDRRQHLMESSAQIRLALQIGICARFLLDELANYPPANLLHPCPSSSDAWRENFHRPCLAISFRDARQQGGASPLYYSSADN